MITSTNTADVLLKRAFGANQCAVIAFEKLLDQLYLDPTVMNPPRTCYIITEKDIKATKLKQKFESVVATKHPNAKIVFINRNSKPIYPNGLQGVDAMLERPAINAIVDAVSKVIEGGDIGTLASRTADTGVDVPDYQPTIPQPVDPYPLPVQTNTSLPQEDIIPDLPPEQPEPEPAPVVPKDEESNLVRRIKATNSVSEVNTLMQEISSAALIKELIDGNSTYAGIEEKLKAITDSIFLIMKDPTIQTLDEKLTKIRSLLHDKAFWSTKGNTLLEQRLEEVIEAICSQTQSLLDSRLMEIDTAIKQVQSEKVVDTGNARLAGLNQEKVNLILELRTLEAEIMEIFKGTDSLITGVASGMADSAVKAGGTMLEEHILATGETVMSEGTRLAMRAALEISASETPGIFKEMKLKIVQMEKVLSKLFELDKEIIMAQQATIDFLRARSIEDTVIAETLIKKSLRVFVADEGCGRTIIPYLLSMYKSRQNANVLLLDLTGTGKYQQYGIQTRELETYLNELNQAEFTLVSGSVEDSVSQAQRIVMALIKSADYYRVINVILRPEQRNLFETIAQDVLCVNYLVDTIPANLDKMRSFIETTKMENVARRVIINRCDVQIRPIVNKLGLNDSLDFQICTIPTIPAISDANLCGYNPYGVGAVTLALEETLRHA